MFSVEQLQYNDDDGTISIRSLKNLSADNVRREIESSILRGNTRRRSINFEQMEMKPYDVEVIEDTVLSGIKELRGIKYRVKLDDNNTLEVYSATNETIVFFIFYCFYSKILCKANIFYSKHKKNRHFLLFISINNSKTPIISTHLYIS